MSQSDLFDKPDDLQHYKQEETVCEHCGHHGTLESKISDLTMKLTVARSMLKEFIEIVGSPIIPNRRDEVIEFVQSLERYV